MSISIEGREGQDISEMYDMFLSGAVAFTDDKKAITNAAERISSCLLFKKLAPFLRRYNMINHPNL